MVQLQKLEVFFSGFKSFHYKKGETILRSGDLAQGVYLLKKGFVKLCSVSEQGKELTLIIYRPGEFFPVVWAFFGRRASIYSFETLTSVDIQRAPREEFMEFLTSNPDVFMDVTKHIITRFQIALRRMEYLTFGNASSQLASVLLICAKDFGTAIDAGIEIQVPFTHKDLANLVGVTRETVSIELKKFERAGLIRNRKRRIIIKNQKKLEKEAILS